ncbi:hypothetical protein PsorP6_004637 [Peronosclerospora sorghi]|uniref:Uncharacterized protein n=1 Tax=Peronosclerospora sorghi TaxID=230839 RepID=A0ACC0VKJ9_9STRA|nr:hypothetical protein PsorP6_004637 [Peronosclerospora sorghi]
MRHGVCVRYFGAQRDQEARPTFFVEYCCSTLFSTWYNETKTAYGKRRQRQAILFHTRPSIKSGKTFHNSAFKSIYIKAILNPSVQDITYYIEVTSVLCGPSWRILATFKALKCALTII